jgi:hypothetical protein
MFNIMTCGRCATLVFFIAVASIGDAAARPIIGGWSPIDGDTGFPPKTPSVSFPGQRDADSLLLWHSTINEYSPRWPSLWGLSRRHGI